MRIPHLHHIRSAITLILLAGSAIGIKAETIVNYGFTGSSYGPETGSVNTSFVSLASNISFGAGITEGANAGIQSTGFDPTSGGTSPTLFITNAEGGGGYAGTVLEEAVNAAFTANDYFEFSIVAADSFNINSLSFAWRSNNTDFRAGYAVKAQVVDGASTVIQDFDSATNLDATYLLNGGGVQSATSMTSVSIGLSSFDYLQNIAAGSTVTFRIYSLDNNAAANRRLNFDNIIVDGTLTTIPEPSSSAGLISGLFFGYILLKRRRQ